RTGPPIRSARPCGRPPRTWGRPAPTARRGTVCSACRTEGGVGVIAAEFDDAGAGPSGLLSYGIALHVCHAAFCNRTRSFSVKPATSPSIPTGLSLNNTARKTHAARYDPARVG